MISTFLLTVSPFFERAVASVLAMMVSVGMILGITGKLKPKAKTCFSSDDRHLLL